MFMRLCALYGALTFIRAYGPLGTDSVPRLGRFRLRLKERRTSRFRTPKGCDNELQAAAFQCPRYVSQRQVYSSSMRTMRSFPDKQKSIASVANSSSNSATMAEYTRQSSKEMR